MSGAGSLALPVLRVALYEGRGAEPLDGARRLALMRTLLDKGLPGDAGRVRPRDRRARAVPTTATRWRCSAASRSASRPRRSAPIPAAGSGSAKSATRRPTRWRRWWRPSGPSAEAREPGNWKPWFPVIDFDRCTNCMQCLSFCLFDVYGVSKGGQIQVQNHDNCKTDCPACSRVCPEVAILFPKYRHGPIHGGEIQADDVRREAMKVDISALLGGDIYAALRDRSEKAKSRFSKERDEERALKERQKCLVKLQKNLDIPAEVLASLPTLDEIQAKAETAKARAQAAIDAAAARQEG